MVYVSVEDACHSKREINAMVYAIRRAINSKGGILTDNNRMSTCELIGDNLEYKGYDVACILIAEESFSMHAGGNYSNSMFGVGEFTICIAM